jgi:hypothetical protein
MASVSTSEWPPPRASVRPEPPGSGERNDERRSDPDARPMFERIVSELLRKGLDAGRGSFERVGETIAPKELAASIVSQLGDLRSGIVRAVAHEVGRFLREADVADVARNVLDGLSVEAKVQLRYKKSDDDKAAKPRARAQRTSSSSSSST